MRVRDAAEETFAAVWKLGNSQNKVIFGSIVFHLEGRSVDDVSLVLQVFQAGRIESTSGSPWSQPLQSLVKISGISVDRSSTFYHVFQYIVRIDVHLYFSSSFEEKSFKHEQKDQFPCQCCLQSHPKFEVLA